MDEGLGQVPAELALLDVELLGEQPRGTAGSPCPIEPAHGLRPIPVLQVGERRPEAAQEERSLGLANWPLVGSEAVEEPIHREVVDNGSERTTRPRIRARKRPAHAGVEQRGIKAVVTRGALPVAGRVEGFSGGSCENGIR